ncbi:hypothetical protein CMUS01_01172 [Colletotrichum musicola]|uniref:Uncharacterized protein n=1 Tax=Colletotrichum musicola TaxID=2175873 RepID=A0A8H6NXQ8_9PEZI|nr:hypothetical protein CMUS01_01172 [Colletotrichum musicola]
MRCYGYDYGVVVTRRRKRLGDPWHDFALDSPLQGTSGQPEEPLRKLFAAQDNLRLRISRKERLGTQVSTQTTPGRTGSDGEQAGGSFHVLGIRLIHQGREKWKEREGGVDTYP